MVTTVIPAVPYRRDADRSTGSSTGSGWRSSRPAASTCSCSWTRGWSCATRPSPAATPARTSGSPTSSIDHFLPWRVAGWSNDFFAGFPAGQFYFPFPAVLIVVLDVFLPYNVAFKLVTALGPVAFPVSAYVFARGIRVPRPAAPLFAVARHRVHVLQGRRRRDHDVRLPHHGRHAGQHPRGRVLVHARVGAGALLPGHAARARSTAGDPCGCPRCCSRSRSPATSWSRSSRCWPESCSG